MRRMLVPIAVLGLAFSAGCGDQDRGGDAAGAPNGAAANDSAATDSKQTESKQQQVENLIADCMKKQGFQYVPGPPTKMDPDAGRFTGAESVLEPADEVRKFRQKYGFGVFGALVYPNDPAVAKPDFDPSKNPNNAIRERLDPSRRKAWDEALDGKSQSKDKSEEEAKTERQDDKEGKNSGCSGEANFKVYGDTASDKAGQKANSKAQQRAYAAFQADPEVVAAAQKWADCLRGKGYKVDSARPGDIELSMATAAMDGELPTDAGDNAKMPTGGEATAAVGGETSLPPEVAKAGLQREIKAALADLDCRTEYAALARTKYAKVITDGNGAG